MNELKNLRIEKKMTQATLANKANIGLRHLQKIEAGDNIPSVYIALDIAKALGTTVEKIFNRVSNNSHIHY